MLHYTSLCLVALQPFPKLFFREKEAPLERLMASPLFLKVAFCLAISSRPSCVCYCASEDWAALSPNAAACLARIFKLSLRIPQKLGIKAIKTRGRVAGGQNKRTRLSLVQMVQNHICKKCFGWTFCQRTEESTCMSAKYRPAVSKRLLLDQNVLDKTFFSSKRCFVALPCHQPHQQWML